MIEMRKEILYEKAIEEWGETAQIRVLQEELCELSLSLHHLLRKNRKVTYHEIADETADVKIMLEQFNIIHPMSDLIANAKKKKLRKLAKYLNYDWEKPHVTKRWLKLKRQNILK